MQDPTYVSVYVPPALGDHRSSSPSFGRQKTRSIRRLWNSLSRLQKSFLFMSFAILLLLGVFASTQSWIPDVGDVDTNSNIRTAENIANRNSAEAVIGNPEALAHLSSRLPHHKGHLFGLERDTIEHVQKLSSVVPNPPAFNTNADKQKISHQVAEDIRSMIALDPAIPLSKTKITKPPAKSPGGIRLKFDGPKNERQQEVVKAFLHAWNGYKTYAWGQDHLHPITGGGQDWFGLALTLVDSLDTMYIMGLNNEFFEARDWVENSLSFSGNKNVNLFETTIRVLGGLLSAYHLSGDQVFLTKSQELGSILLAGFKSPSGIPYSDINLRTKTAHGPSWNPDSTTSEVSTLQLEFRDLARATNVPIFEAVSMNVSLHIHKQPKVDGLVPIHITPATGSFRPLAVITLGARGDSYYEYLLKQWIQTGKKIDFLRDDYLLAVEGMKNRLLQRTTVSNLTYLGELDNGGKTFRPKMDHLVCYLPGTLALGVAHGLPSWHMDLAKSLLYTCYLTYKQQPTGLAPEITYFKSEDDAVKDFMVKTNDAHNLLRPETIESLWYLYQITGETMYQDWGWEIFQSFQKYTRVNYGYTSIGSVLHPENTRPRDMMESFFLAETLKYFYLLFSDRPVFDLNRWVFNTEAHPLPVFDH